MGQPEFVLFGVAHIATLATVCASAVAAGLLGRSRAGMSPAVHTLAAALVLQEVVKLYYYIGIADEPWQLNLPLHLCRVNELLCVVMLLARSYRVFEVSYFLAMAGSVSAMLTPALSAGFPHPKFVLFFVGHGLAVIAVVYAIFAFGFRPRPRSIAITLGLTAAYAVLIAPLNYVLDSNYLYLREQPEPATLLALFGPWPWYVLALFGLTFVACGLAYAPFALADAFRGSVKTTARSG